MTQAEKGVWRVGVFMNDSKYGKLRGHFGKAAQLCDSPPLEVRRISSVDEAADCDVVVHKVFDLNIGLAAGDEELLSRHPRLLDPLPSVRLLSDRRLTLQALADFLASLRSPLTVSVPPTVLHPGRQPPTWAGPSIAKPVSACSDPHSHMLLLLAEPVLASTLLSAHDYIVQQFLPHGDHLLKAYVIGASIDFVWKASLRAQDFSPDTIVAFDSQSLKTDLSRRQAMPPPLSPSLQEAIRHMLAALQRFLQLQLFGVDLLVTADHGVHIVDVNYFPGYSGVPDLGRKLLDLVKRA